MNGGRIAASPGAARAASDVPRLRCSGEGVEWSHDEVVLSIATADPLTLRCPICGDIEHIAAGSEGPDR